MLLSGKLYCHSTWRNRVNHSDKETWPAVDFLLSSFTPPTPPPPPLPAKKVQYQSLMNHTTYVCNFVKTAGCKPIACYRTLANCFYDDYTYTVGNTFLDSRVLIRREWVNRFRTVQPSRVALAHPHDVAPTRLSEPASICQFDFANFSLLCEGSLKKRGTVRSPNWRYQTVRYERDKQAPVFSTSL